MSDNQTNDQNKTVEPTAKDDIALKLTSLIEDKIGDLSNKLESKINNITVKASPKGSDDQDNYDDIFDKVKDSKDSDDIETVINKKINHMRELEREKAEWDRKAELVDFKYLFKNPDQRKVHDLVEKEIQSLVAMARRSMPHKSAEEIALNDPTIFYNAAARVAAKNPELNKPVKPEPELVNAGRSGSFKVDVKAEDVELTSQDFDFCKRYGVDPQALRKSKAKSMSQLG